MPDAPLPIIPPASAGSTPAVPGAIIPAAGGGSTPDAPVSVVAPADAGTPPVNPLTVQPGNVATPATIFTSADDLLSTVGSLSSVQQKAMRNGLSAAPGGGAAFVRLVDGSVLVFGATAATDTERGAALTAAFAAVGDGGYLECGPGDFYLAEIGMQLTKDATYIFRGSYLYIDASSTNAAGGGLNRVMISGPTGVGGWKIDGRLMLDGKNIGLRVGITLNDAENVTVKGVTVQNFGYYGIVANSGSAKGMVISGCFGTNCSTAFKMEHEYMRITDCIATGNIAFGFQSRAGNQRFMGCSASHNPTNLYLNDTVNGGHSVWMGGDLNHATQHNLKVKSAFTNGFTFVGAHFYDAVGSIDLGGEGVSFIGGDIACPVECTSGILTGLVDVTGVNFPQSSAAVLLAGLSVANRKNVKLVGCKEFNKFSPANELPTANVPGYADNAAAVVGGLVVGDFYRVGADLKVVV